MSATIKDVARLAGCSIKTVSRVINEEPYVTPDLRTRVQTAIRTSGYTPNISARRLVKQQAYSLCILMYPGFYQATSAVLSPILDIGYEENYDIFIQPFFSAHARSRNKLVTLIGEHRFDGYVVTPPCDADDFVADLLTTYKVPLVQINPFNRSEKIPFVAGDDEHGAFLMTEHLIEKGHRRIGFLMGPRNMRPSFDRLRGYQAALEAHGLEYEAGLVENSEFTFDGGYTARAVTAGASGRGRPADGDFCRQRRGGLWGAVCGPGAGSGRCRGGFRCADTMISRCPSSSGPG